MQIDYLADHLHFAPMLARWHYDEWRELLPQWSYAEALADLQSHTRRGCIPTTFVAVEGGQLVGSVSLLTTDIENWQHLSPWLASLFVIPAQRGKGVGSKLVARVIAEAKRLQAAKLYLFTAEQEDFYRKLNWSVHERVDFHGHAVTVMCCHTG